MEFRTNVSESLKSFNVIVSIENIVSCVYNALYAIQEQNSVFNNVVVKITLDKKEVWGKPKKQNYCFGKSNTGSTKSSIGHSAT